MSSRHEKYRRLIEATKTLPPVTTAVAHPCDESALSGAVHAGIVLGARVPIILTSRADSVEARLASCAVAALVAQARREQAAKVIT